MTDFIDEYLTIDKPSKGLFKDKGSKFIALAYPVTNEEEIKKIQEELRDEYHDARHHCYAYMLGVDKKIYRANDDGEPSSTAGKPILGQIRSFNLTNILIVVIRYFGGTKLGVGGLINAYKTASEEALKSAKVIKRTLHEIYQIKFEYQAMNEVMRVLKEENLNQVNQKFDLSCSISISFRKADTQKILEKFNRIDNIKIEYLKTK